MNFGQAVEALKKGEMVRRTYWDNPKVFVFMQVPATIGKDIVPKMQSLPQSVKVEFQRRFDNPSEQVDSIYYNDQLAIVNTSNLISGYSPSSSDALAEDWVVLNN